jgi:preprotein translocase SecE subunit
MRPQRRFSIVAFLGEVLDELRQVSWPTREALVHNATVYVGTVAVIAAGIATLDFAIGGGFTQLLGTR